MFRRFWSTKWAYGNRRHWCSFKATINWLIWNDVELVGLQNCYLGFSKLWKFWKLSKKVLFFSFRNSFPSNQNFQKTVTYVRGSHEYVYKISSRYLQKWLRYSIKHVKKQALFTSFRDFTVIFRILFLTDFDASKSVLGSFFAFFAKIWPKNMYRSSKSRKFFVWPFSPGDLRWPWPVLWSQSTGNDTYRCQWHYPCRFIGFVCA